MAASPRWLSLLVTVISVPVLAAWIHFAVGWQPLLAPWRALPPASAVLLVALMSVSALARAARIHDYFHAAVGHAPLTTLRLTLLHNLFNNLLPMRTGEAAFPLLMKRYFGESLTASTASLLWLRVLDLAALLSISLSVMLAAGTLSGTSRLLVATALFGTVVTVLALPSLRHAGHSLSRREDRVSRLLGTVLVHLPASRLRYTRIVLSTVVTWAAKLAAFLWLAMLFTGLPAAQAMLGVAAGELSSVLPVHGLAGAGTYEGAMVGALVLSGAAHEPALVAAVNLHVFVLGVSVLFGLVARLIPVPAAGERPIRDAIG
jgi:hypothetical protein